ncbi:MAG: ABC-2 family transporter protein [Bdellovibrionales bacterium]|nr:ABC-2 family transporter protein [Bdellovibrionales bacterium]
MRTLSIYGSYFNQFLMSRLAYKWDFFASLIANIVVTLSGLLFIVLLIDGEAVPSLQGWTREEVLFIYGYSMISLALFNTLSPNLYRFGDKYVIEGQFDRVLLRPLNTLCQVLFESFNLESVGSLFVGIWLIFYTGASLGMEFGALDYLWLLVSGISGGIILTSVFVLLASLSFHFQDRLGIGAPVYNLINFGRYPLPIFNNVVQFVLKWVVPFAFVAFFPATHFFSRPGFEFFCYFTPGMAAICLLVAALAWTYGVSKYTSTGS